MDPVQLNTEPKSSSKVIVELDYFPSSNRILTQEKKAKRNKIIASSICKVMIKTLNNFLNNFNSYLFVSCCLLSLQLIKYSSFLRHFPLFISNDSFLPFSFSYMTYLFIFVFKNILWFLFMYLFKLVVCFCIKTASLCIYINYDCKSLVKPKKKREEK